jgi:hypothetical protein
MAIPLPGGVRIKVATQLTAELGKVIKAYGTKWQGSGFLDPPFPGSNPGAPASHPSLCHAISGCGSSVDISAGLADPRQSLSARSAT